MATTDKDFVVKNGLIVQGTQGTIDGSVIVTEAALNTSLEDYIALIEKGAPDGVATLDENVNVITQTALVFEGSEEDAYELSLTVTNPTSDITISLPNVNGTIVTTGNINDAFPSQTSNEGKYLTTDGTNVSWATGSGGGSNIIVTDAYTSGDTIYIGDTQPTTPNEGDVWIDESSVTGAITWGQLKALEGIASGG